MCVLTFHDDKMHTESEVLWCSSVVTVIKMRERIEVKRLAFLILDSTASLVHRVHLGFASQSCTMEIGTGSKSSRMQNMIDVGLDFHNGGLNEIE